MNTIKSVHSESGSLQKRAQTTFSSHSDNSTAGDKKRLKTRKWACFYSSPIREDKETHTVFVVEVQPWRYMFYMYVTCGLVER